MWTRPEAKWRVSAGFWLVLGMLFYLDEGVGLLPWGILACLAHELGHLGAAKCLGGHLEQVSLTAVGAEMTMRYSRTLSYGEDTVVALAGPAANLVLGGLAWAGQLYVLTALSLGVGAFNLLPIRPLDGARILRNYLAPRMGPERADWWETGLSALLVGGLVGVGAIVMGAYANVTLLLTSTWLFWGVVRRETLGWWRTRTMRRKKGK